MEVISDHNNQNWRTYTYFAKPVRLLEYMPCVLSNTTLSSTTVETVIHPRNLNLVFVAYAGSLRELLKGLQVHLSDMVVRRWCYLN